jgi:uncharacterized BrkB/YihY/UPF0761 family membrane protein
MYWDHSPGRELRAVGAERIIARAIGKDPPQPQATHEEAMMNMRFLVSVVVLFITSMVLGFVVHGLLLGAEYAKLTNLFRNEQDGQAHFTWMLIAHVFIAVGFTWVYRAGRNTRPWLGQGVRFGIAVAVLATIPGYLIYYAVQPMPFDLVVKQIVFDTLAMIVMGVVAAAVNRDPIGAALPQSGADEDLSPMPR